MTTTTRDELFHAIFTTALEGGVNYWSSCSHYQWTNPDESEDYKGFFAVIHDEEDEDDKENEDRGYRDRGHRIDRATISKGYKLATTTYRDRISWSCDKPPLVITDDTDWDYDAGDADAIVQLGLFGDVIYG